MRNCHNSMRQASKLDMSKPVKLPAVMSIRLCLWKRALVASNKMRHVNENIVASTKIRLIYYFADVSRSRPICCRMEKLPSQTTDLRTISRTVFSIIIIIPTEVVFMIIVAHCSSKKMYGRYYKSTLSPKSQFKAS